MSIALPGTGGAGMEACLVTLLEPGDRVIIGVNGLFAERMVEIARRNGAEVVALEAEWGRIIEPDAVRTPWQLPARSHEAALAAELGRVTADLATRPGTRSVVLAHAFVGGGQPSESERDICHVEESRTRIPTRLEVIAGRNGSRVAA